PREFPGNRNLEFMRQPIWFYKAKALQQLQVNMLQKKIYLTKNGQMKVSISIGEEPASINLPSDLVQLVQASTEIQNNETEEFFFDHPYFWAAFTLIGSPW
ncbi:MAG: CHAT domain-containing protein, partial [Geitlerinemataceae cyanobacterium]